MNNTKPLLLGKGDNVVIVMYGKEKGLGSDRCDGIPGNKGEEKNFLRVNGTGASI